MFRCGCLQRTNFRFIAVISILRIGKIPKSHVMMIPINVMILRKGSFFIASP